MMRRDQYEGSMVGLGVGDALGYPAEFRTREQILREIGPRGIEDFIALKDARFSRPTILGPDQPPGTFSDDTQMSIAVAQGLIEVRGDDLDQQMQAVARHFVLWSQSDDNNRSPGGTCMEGCENLSRGVPWREAGVADSKGCGSAMRVAPIGLLYARDLEGLERVARASSVLTHGHLAALEGAVAAALMVALALEGATALDMYMEIMKRCGGRSPDFDTCFAKLPRLVEEPPEVALVDVQKGGVGEAWVAEEAAASALYCYWRHPGDFSAAVLTATNTDGDSDSIAAITGSVLGARLGLDHIPESWFYGVERGPELQFLGRLLWENRR